MTRNTLILTTIVVLAAAVLFGRYVLVPHTQPATSASEQTTSPDEAAKAASRAMTFTQPKAPSE